MRITENQPLKAYNTFGVEASARCFVEIREKEDLPRVFAQPSLIPRPHLIVGGGSNILFTGDFEGTVIKISIKGIRIKEKGAHIYVQAGAGEVWNELVQYCVKNNLGGIENLTLIPGLAGAAPIQNIGAYGIELKDVFHSLEAFDVQEGGFKKFYAADCEFGYRDSVFKGRLKGRYIVVSVTLKLSRRHQLNVSYGSIRDELRKRGITRPDISDVSRVVGDIRVFKLPDPSMIGNAGSFFKNPVIDRPVYEQLRKKFPDVVNFPMPDGRVKIAAGWLIEKCGWKGKKIGNAGTWKNQALVLVNHGQASGREILQLSETIRQAVQDIFGIRLEREVNVI